MQTLCKRSCSTPVQAIAEHCSSNILLPDGTLNRQQLGQIVFSSLDERRWLEQQIHPYVRNTFSKALLGHRNELSLQNTPVRAHSEPVVLVVPLLFEAGMTDLVTEIWVVLF